MATSNLNETNSVGTGGCDSHTWHVLRSQDNPRTILNLDFLEAPSMKCKENEMRPHLPLTLLPMQQTHTHATLSGLASVFSKSTCHLGHSLKGLGLPKASKYLSPDKAPWDSKSTCQCQWRWPLRCLPNPRVFHLCPLDTSPSFVTSCSAKQSS